MSGSFDSENTDEYGNQDIWKEGEGNASTQPLMGPGDFSYPSRRMAAANLPQHFHVENSSSDVSSRERSRRSQNTTQQAVHDVAQQTQALCREREKIIEELKEICKPHDPLTILILGTQGVAKSSFINTIGAALSDKWREHAPVGEGGSVTVKVQRYDNWCKFPQYEEFQFPSLIDVAGLENNNDKAMTELLKLLFYGYIKDYSAVNDVYIDCKTLTPDELREKYSTHDEKMKVDRIIFVVPAPPRSGRNVSEQQVEDEDSNDVEAATADLPIKLMECIRNVARPSGSIEKREIPLFCLMTKKDLIDVESQDYKDRKRVCFNKLGLNETRFSVLSCYCDQLDRLKQRTKKNFPKLDVPALEFLAQVCNPARKVTCAAEILTKPGGRNSRWLRWLSGSVVTFTLETLTFLVIILIIVLAAMYRQWYFDTFQSKEHEFLEKICNNDTLRKQLQNEVDPLMCVKEPFEKKCWDWLFGKPVWDVLTVYLGFLVGLVSLVFVLRKYTQPQK